MRSADLPYGLRGTDLGTDIAHGVRGTEVAYEMRGTETGRGGCAARRGCATRTSLLPVHPSPPHPLPTKKSLLSPQKEGSRVPRGWTRVSGPLPGCLVSGSDRYHPPPPPPRACALTSSSLGRSAATYYHRAVR
eukprot:3941309-Rhodomonas_salina.2